MTGGLYRDGIYNDGLYSYGLYSHGLYSYSLYVRGWRGRALHNQIAELKGNIRVFARIRPITLEETEEGERALLATSSNPIVTVTQPRPRPIPNKHTRPAP